MSCKSKIFNLAFILFAVSIFFVSDNVAQEDKKLFAPIPQKARDLLKNGRKQAVEQDEIDKGLMQIKEAIRIAPNFVAAHSEYVRLKAYWLGQLAETQAEYEELMRQEPGNPIYPLALAQGLQFTPRAKKDDWFSAIAQLAPEWAWGHFAKARASESTNQNIALPEMLKAIEKDSTEPVFYTSAIPMLIKVKRLDEANTLFEKLPVQIDQAVKQNLLWDLQVAREGNSAETIDKLKAELGKLLETSRDVNLLKAVRLRYQRLKVEDKIKEAEEKIIALDPAWYPQREEIAFTINFDGAPKRVYYAGRQNQINNKLQSMDYEAAPLEQIVQIESLFALKPNPTNARYINLRLLALSVQIKDAKRAIKYGERILASNPQDAVTLARLATVYAEKNNFQKADEYSARAMELTKEFQLIERPADIDEKMFNNLLPEKRQRETYGELRSIVLNSRAFALAASSKTAEAESLLRESLSLRASEESYLQLEKTLRKLGKNEEANKAAFEAENFWRNKLKASFINEPLKDFELTTIKGEKIKLSALKGKVVMLNYWATWCVPCIKEMPLFVEIYNKYKAQGLEILAVSVDSLEDRPKIAPYVEKTKIGFPVLYDENSAQSYGVHSYPTTIFIDREGVVRYRTLGLDVHYAKRNLEFILSELMEKKS